MAKKKIQTTFFSRYKGIVTFFIVIAAVFSFSTIVRAHGGDSSLHHACVGTVNGRLTIVGVNDECGGNETAMDWIKNVFAGTGLTIERGDKGATLSADLTYVQKRVSSTCTTGNAIKAIGSDGTVTCEPVTATVARYQGVSNGGINPIGSSVSQWVDISSAAVTATFSAGTIKVTYAGRFILQNGDGTAYVRLKVLPTGGSASYVADSYVFRASSPSSSEYSNIPFTTQALVSVSSGEYTITPQVHLNNASWGLSESSQLIVEQ